jgi:hypothetical protein
VLMNLPGKEKAWTASLAARQDTASAEAAVQVLR